jgi:lipase chaperone LimK
MPVSFVLRLVPESLSEGQIVGRIEVVGTGEQASLRNARELIDFLQSQGISPAPDNRDVCPNSERGQENATGY